jgi:hypothetical protein
VYFTRPGDPFARKTSLSVSIFKIAFRGTTRGLPLAPIISSERKERVGSFEHTLSRSPFTYEIYGPAMTVHPVPPVLAKKGKERNGQRMAKRVDFPKVRAFSHIG